VPRLSQYGLSHLTQTKPDVYSQIRNPDGEVKPFKSDDTWKSSSSDLYSQIRNPDGDIRSFKNDDIWRSPSTSRLDDHTSPMAPTSLIVEEVKRLEHKIEVSKTDNSWENRQLATEINDMNLKVTERLDGLTRDYQQQKLEFYNVLETWNKEIQSSIENVNLRLDRGDGAASTLKPSSFERLTEKKEDPKKSEKGQETKDTNDEVGIPTLVAIYLAMFYF